MRVAQEGTPQAGEENVLNIAIHHISKFSFQNHCKSLTSL